MRKINRPPHLGVVEVAGRLEIDAQTVLLRLVAAGRAPVPDEEPALPVGLLGLLLVLLVLGRRAGRRQVVVELVQRLGIVGLVVGPVLRVGVAVGAARAVVALPVHAALCNRANGVTPSIVRVCLARGTRARVCGFAFLLFSRGAACGVKGCSVIYVRRLSRGSVA